jgi:hypothetical protein
VINLGKLGKDAKDLIVGIDGSDKEPNDFKTELQDAIKNGVVTKSDGTLLITSRLNADKLGEQIDKAQIKGVSIASEGKEFDSPEEAKEYQAKKAEQLRKRKEKEAEALRLNQENVKAQKAISQKSKEEVAQKNSEKERS